MSAVVACPEPRSSGLANDRAEGGPPTLAGAHAGGRLTLEQRLDSVWEGLRAGGAAECPVCHAAFMTTREGAPVRCGGCRSLLS